MTKHDDKNLEALASETVIFSDTAKADEILTTVEVAKGGPKTFVYSSSWASSDIVDDSTDAAGFCLEPVEKQTLTEIMDRGRGLGRRGFNFDVELTKGKFRFELKPSREILRRETVTYRKTPKPKKKKP
jgi:hypothetical protein